MNIRKAEKKDIPQIETLLYQVAKVHSDGRPDLFQAGKKNTPQRNWKFCWKIAADQFMLQKKIIKY